MSLLAESVIYLLAALICVPISRWLGFGSVLGYLAAGIIIGPFGLALIADAEHILHFAELGVVFLLFIIGLELKPSRLWVLRRMVFGLGAAQVVLTAALLAVLAWLAGITPLTATIIGLILALSSTAFVLQMLAEKHQLTTSHGRAAFSILLFQDLAVIPLIALLPLVGDSDGGNAFDVVEVTKSISIVAAMIIGGRYLLRPVLNIAAGSRIPELFTATALLVVIGAALLMYLAGMSMVLGAFIAGILLADSEYRHQLEGDIAPFKGLLLGLFFIAVGMSVNIGLLLEGPLRIAAIVAALMIAKAAIMIPLARGFGMCDGKSAVRLAAAMSQGGEFAFVLFALATREGVLSTALSDELTLAVTASMMLTPFFYIAAEKLTQHVADSTADDYDEMVDQHNDVIIVGFGRVGQVVGRMLRIVNRPFTALESDASQVNLARSYGNKIHFGDATRLDVLRAAGADHAKLFVIALPDMEMSLKIAETVQRNFPKLKIIARARNRRHAHKLMDIGVDHIFRDTLLSSAAMGEVVLEGIGLDEERASHVTKTFLERDEELLERQHAVHDSQEKLIQSSQDTVRELTSLLAEDIKK